ncbi:Hypothetical predicted protein [Cloeon dipterum]|nr:Hypothetical predicted protein [Cloeon dipterum]
MGSLWLHFQFLLTKRRLNNRIAQLGRKLEQQLDELRQLGLDTSRSMDDAPPFASMSCTVLDVRGDVLVLSGGIHMPVDPVRHVKIGDKLVVVKKDQFSDWKTEDSQSVIDIESEVLDQEVEVISIEKDDDLKVLEGYVVLYHSSSDTLIIGPDNVSVQLGDINCNFTFLDDDLVQYTMRGGKIVKVTPKEDEIFESTVLKCNSSGGFIRSPDNKMVVFSYSACDVHYMPRQGDTVCVKAIPCQRKDAQLRAVKMVLQSLSTEGGGIYSEEVCELLEESTEICTSSHFDCGKLQLGCKGRLSPVLVNKGIVCHALTAVYPLRAVSPNPQFKVVYPVQFPVYVAPGESVRVDLECKPTQEGAWRDLFVFDFDKGQLQIGRFFAVETEFSENKGDCYKKDDDDVLYSETCRKPKMCFDTNGNFNLPLVKAPKTKPSNPFRRRVQNYNLPENVKQIVQELSESSRDNVLVTLQNRFPFLAEEVDTYNYVPRFKLLLHIEEAEASRVMSRWNMNNTPLEKDLMNESVYMVYAPNLSERRPSILFGDSVHVRNMREGTLYEGQVMEIYQEKVKFRLPPSFPVPSAADLYSIKFAISRGNFKFQHTAIEEGWKKLGNQILFPSEPLVKENDDPQVSEIDLFKLMESDNSSKIWFNPALNERQRAAVRNILAGEYRPLPYVIFGPPGTGKTVTLVETILQIFKRVPVCRILVATPSNNAADLVTELLIRANPSIKPVTLTRLVAFNYRKGVPAYLQKYMVVVKGEGNFDVNMDRNKITVGTCASIGRLCLYPKMPFYTHVFIDEAGQASEPETMCAIALMGKPRQIVLAGDPKQLGPVITGKIAVQGGLDTSWLSRILNSSLYKRDEGNFPLTQGYNPYLVTMLTKNYRTVPEILSLPSKLFYNDLLEPMVSSVDGPYVNLMHNLACELPQRCNGPPAFVFHGVRGCCCRDVDSPSWYNPVEARLVFEYVKKLMRRNVKSWNIGIITFYAKQTAKVKELLRSDSISDLKVGSVEEFQGQERDVMLLSTVRSSAMVEEGLGFISSPNRINVALTRARALLIVVGDPHLLKNDPNWRAVLIDCVSRNAYLGCDLPFQNQPAVNSHKKEVW